MFIARFMILAAKFSRDGFEPFWVGSDDLQEARQLVIQHAETELSLIFYTGFSADTFDMYHKDKGTLYTVKLKRVQ